MPPAQRRIDPEAPEQSAEYRMPVMGARLLSGFGQRGRKFHTGLDLKNRPKGGDPVLATKSGVVAQVRRTGGYGLMVLLRHEDGWFSRYAHLRRILVREGERVRVGRQLGTVGATGNADRPHLHFEILTPEKKPVDPAPLLFKKR